MNVARDGPVAAIVCIFSAVLIGGTVELKRAPHQIDINIDGKPFTTYYFDPEVAKPYLMPLRTASGDIVTRGFPIRNDVSAGNPKAGSFEPHQRPLYFGHGDIDGLDFWEEPVFDKYYSDHGHQAYGHMVLKSIEESREEQETAMIRARFTLDDPSNRVIGEETQSFSFHGDGQTRVIDCVFVLYATAGPLDMGDTKEGTFGIRLAPELSAPLGHMVNSSGADGERAIWASRPTGSITPEPSREGRSVWPYSITRKAFATRPRGTRARTVYSPPIRSAYASSRATKTRTAPGRFRKESHLRFAIAS